MRTAPDQRHEGVARQVDVHEGAANEIGCRTSPVEVERQRALFAKQRVPQLVRVPGIQPALDEPVIVHERRQVAQQPQVLDI